MSKRILYILSLLTFSLFVANLFWGSVAISFSDVFKVLTGGEVENKIVENIVLQSRLPQAITALLAGASLAAAGLLLQTAGRIRKC